MPRGVVDFTFIRAPVKRIAYVLSKGFPSGEHVYDLTPRWRVADCSRGVPFAHINGARREFPPAVEAHALHGACDAFEFYINVAPSDSGMKSYVQLASFWRGNGGAGLDVNIMPDTCFEAFVFLEGVRSAGVFPAGVLPEDFSLGWRYLEYISRARRPRFSPDTHMVWRDRSSPERCVELFGVRDFGKAPLHRLCRMHGTGDVLRFGLRVVEGEALLEIGIDRRTSPGGAVCTMWNIL